MQNPKYIFRGLGFAAVVALIACGGGGGGGSGGSSATGGAPGVGSGPAVVGGSTTSTIITTTSTTALTTATVAIAAVNTTMVGSPTVGAASSDTVPTVVAVNAVCSGAPVSNASATVKRVWFAQTHLMETSWPFYYLLANRDAMMKIDVDAPSGATPQVMVTANWPGVASESLCARAPAALPTTTDMNTMPANQNLATSYALSLPARWLRADLTLNVSVQGSASAKTYLPADLKIATEPVLSLTSVDMMLFGDTVASVNTGWEREYAAKLPVSRMTHNHFPVPLVLSSFPVTPSSNDSGYPTTQSGPFMANAMPSCTAANKAISNCTFGGFSVMSSLLKIVAALRDAFGEDMTGDWYALVSKNRDLGGGLGGGHTGTGSDFGLIFNHEAGHGFSLPHWGDRTVGVAGSTASTFDTYPYSGDSNPFVGGGVGKTWAFDGTDNTLVAPTCSGAERNDPMQRLPGGTACTQGGANFLKAGQKFDFYSDFSAARILRNFTGAQGATTAANISGTVAYWSVNSGGTAAAPVQSSWGMSSESGRAHFGLVNPATGVRPIKVFDQTTAQWNTLQRPPGVDGYLTAPPLAPAGVTYDRYFDFNYPSEWNRPVITVLGSFYQPDAPGAVFSKIFTPIRSKGTMKRLFDPSDVTTFTNIKSSRSGSSFYWGYNLHLKVEYANGTTRMVAMPDDSTSLKYWAVNLPDDGLQISKISLLYRPLCSRNTSDSTACNINHVSNAGVTAANFYNTATVYATWTP